MSILDRILLVLLSLAGVIAAGAVIAVSTGLVENINYTVLTTSPQAVYLTIGAIVLAIISLRFLFYRVRGSVREDYVVLPSDHGMIRISFETIQQLSNRTGKIVRGVQEFDTRVRNGQSGLILVVRVKALPDIDLAAMSLEIQTSVKSYVEKTTGVNVEQVAVNIAEIATSASKPPRAWVES